MNLDFLADPGTRWVLAGSVLLGASAGLLGSFALLRRRSLMGDAVAHSALPGVAVAFMLAGTRSLPLMLLGAAIAGLLGALFIQVVTNRSRIKEDTALGLVLSVFFALGIVLLTQIQHSGAGGQSGLDSFIFGQAAALVEGDVQLMAVSAGVVCLAAILLFKEFKLLCFDRGFAAGAGFNPSLLDGLLMALIVGVVVIGMQAVGVVLMAALLITPAAAARFWTERLGLMVALAAFFGGASGAAGTIVSALGLRLPTGPLVVLAATAFFALSILFAPRRGVLAAALRLLSLRGRVARENILRTFYELVETAGGLDAQVAGEDIAAKRSERPATIKARLKKMAREGLVRVSDSLYSLSEKGLEAAYAVTRRHRLWEMYLMHEEQLDSDHVDRDADKVEHYLPPRLEAELEELLKFQGRELRLPPSVHPIRSGEVS